jgi:hypothetical protein
LWRQHPLADMPPNRLPGLAAPPVEAMAGAHSVEDDALAPDAAAPVAAAAAVVPGACVEVLGSSPGNCSAVCELIDGEALMPVDPVVTAVPCSEAFDPAAETADELDSPDWLEAQSG